MTLSRPKTSRTASTVRTSSGLPHAWRPPSTIVTSWSAADLGPDAQGNAFLEVPTAADELPLVAPAGVAVHWLARDSAVHGARLIGELTDQLGHGPVPLPEVADPDIWETPTYSSSGETLVAAAETDDLYVWIAGEAAMVTALRRFLVSDLGTPRSHVAFMGYWRKGKAALA